MRNIKKVVQGVVLYTLLFLLLANIAANVFGTGVPLVRPQIIWAVWCGFSVLQLLIDSERWRIWLSHAGVSGFFLWAHYANAPFLRDLGLEV